MDVCYHVHSYWQLRDAARTVEDRSSSQGQTATPFVSIVMAQLIAYVEDSHKLSELRELYRTMMPDIGSPCSGREQHATRLKDHILHHLPEWNEFGDFLLYVQMCDVGAYCMHGFSPVHVRDMLELARKHPAVYAEYLNGTSRSRNPITNSVSLQKINPTNI